MDVKLEPGEQLGVSEAADQARHFRVSQLEKESRVEASTQVMVYMETYE